MFLDEPLIIKYGGHSGQLSRRPGGIEQYRIKALENILSGATLKNSDRISAIKMLIKKLDILLSGSKKRGNINQMNVVQEKIRNWEKQLSE